jgi:hypothetical protein
MHHYGHYHTQPGKEYVVAKSGPTPAEYRQKGKHHQRQKQHPQNGVALEESSDECAHGWIFLEGLYAGRFVTGCGRFL